MRSRIFRLAHAVAGDLPQLDDIARLAELADVSYTVPDEVVQTVLATGFFFELDEAPMRLHGQYHSRGSALCARNQTRLILKRVLVEFPGAELQTNRGDCLGRVEDDNWCSTCGYYRKGVRFSVASLKMSILSLVPLTGTQSEDIQAPYNNFLTTTSRCGIWAIGIPWRWARY